MIKAPMSPSDGSRSRGYGTRLAQIYTVSDEESALRPPPLHLMAAAMQAGVQEPDVKCRSPTPYAGTAKEPSAPDGYGADASK